MNLPPNPLWTQAQHFTAQRRWRDAIAAYQKVVESSPAFVPGWLELSTACQHVYEYRATHDAVVAASRVGGRLPPPLVAAVSKRLRSLEETAPAMEYIRAAKVIESADPASLTMLAAVAASAGAFDEAKSWLERALRMAPLEGRIWAMLGNVHVFNGDFDEAQNALERAIDLRPDLPTAYLMLSQLRRTDQSTQRIDALDRLLRKHCPPRDEAMLAFALHHELDALGEYDRAWAALQRGCRVKRKTLDHDSGRTRQLFARLQREFPHADVPILHAPVEAPRADAVRPVFIVGMFRSGSTLLERMLSGHPDITDAGETNLFAMQMCRATDYLGRGTLDEQRIERSRGLDLAALGSAYLGALRLRTGAAAVAVDKTNPNFLLLPYIWSALPQAVVLHTYRDPMDTCFSNLRTLFSHEAAYTYDQSELAEYHGLYAALMEHWRRVAPGRMEQIALVDLVADPQHHAERIAALCGLDYDAAMTDVERPGGQIATASSVRARGALSTQHGGAWRPYEQHLQPLIAGLQTAGAL